MQILTYSLLFHYCLLTHEILLEPHMHFLFTCLCVFFFLPIVFGFAYNCSMVNASEGNENVFAFPSERRPYKHIQFSKFFR